MFDPHSLKTVPYPEKLEKVEDFNPEVVFAWAELTRVETDLERVKKDTVELDAEVKIRLQNAH